MYSDKSFMIDSTIPLKDFPWCFVFVLFSMSKDRIDIQIECLNPFIWS